MILFSHCTRTCWLDSGALRVFETKRCWSLRWLAHHLFAYEKPDVFTLAGAYISGLVRNHPFIDGNKRTAFMVGYSFLSRNGKELSASEPEATAIIVDLASRKITEEDLVAWLRLNCE